GSGAAQGVEEPGHRLCRWVGSMPVESSSYLRVHSPAGVGGVDFPGGTPTSALPGVRLPVRLPFALFQYGGGLGAGRAVLLRPCGSGSRVVWLELERSECLATGDLVELLRLERVFTTFGPVLCRSGGTDHRTQFAGVCRPVLWRGAAHRYRMEVVVPGRA